MDRRRKRFGCVALIGMLAALVALFFAGFMTSTGQSHARLWVRDGGTTLMTLRTEPRSPAAEIFLWVGSWAELEDIDEFYLGPPETASNRRKRELAQSGWLPRYRSFSARYEATGETVQLAGELWEEFRLTDPRAETTQVGWWPW